MKKLNKLNPQAMAIKDKKLVGNLVADPGRLLVAEDIISAEPIVTALLSGCPFYTHAVYSGIGVRPFWHKGVLMVDDVYLMFGSVCPVTTNKIKEKFDVDLWMRDKDAVKALLKEERALLKIVVLAAAYGVGVDKLHTIFREKGYTLTKQQVKEVHWSYWNLFKQIKKTIKSLQQKLEEDGFITNLFGYRICPPNTRDAFNYTCQSSVGGLINYFTQLKFEKGKHLDQRFITNIHDMLCTEIPEDMVEESQKVTAEVLIELNAELNWGLTIRTDFKAAKTFFELK